MERFFKVTEKSTLYKEYFDYEENRREVHALAKQFMKDQGIVTHEYGIGAQAFYIIPTQADMDTFGKCLCKAIGDGLRAFKANSKVGKAWVNLLKEKGLTVQSKPFIGFYFKDCLGHFRTRNFAIGKEVYCSVELEHDFSETPEGFEELKASEFYSIIEAEEK